MKTTNAKWTILSVLASGALHGCGSTNEVSARTVENANPVIPAMFYVDGDGAPVGSQTPDSAQIAKVAGTSKAPVMAPDGHAVTWGEFRKARGTANATCQDGGTKVHIQFDGLLANGVYTGWLVFFESPGFKVKMFDALTGLAPIGPPDGSGGKFIADANGAGTLDAMVPAGNVTVPIPNKNQSVPSCLLDAYEVHFVAAYHLDGRTYGPVPGDADKIAEQVGWMFQQGTSE